MKKKGQRSSVQDKEQEQMKAQSVWAKKLKQRGSDKRSELGVFIFPIYSLFDREPRSYLEFPNHLLDW